MATTLFIQYKLLISFDPSSRIAAMLIENADKTLRLLMKLLHSQFYLVQMNKLLPSYVQPSLEKKASKQQSQRILSGNSRGNSRFYDVLPKEIVAAFFSGVVRTARCTQASLRKMITFLTLRDLLYQMVHLFELLAKNMPVCKRASWRKQKLVRVRLL